MPRHLVDLLTDLKHRLERECGMVRTAVERAVAAMNEPDAALAGQIIEGDAAINAEEVRIEQAAIELLALQQPAAGDLRLVASAIKVNSQLERIADCAANIARLTLRVARMADYRPPAELVSMGDEVVDVVHEALRAFCQCDADMARQVLGRDEAVDAHYAQIIADGLVRMASAGCVAGADFSTIMMAKNLERIADHCTNIAEDVIFVHTGRPMRRLRAV